MKKFNDFCEKYETPLWLVIVSISLFVIYFTNPDRSAILGEAIFWIIFAIFYFIQKTLRNKKK